MNRSNPYPSPAEEESIPHRKKKVFLASILFFLAIFSISGVWAVECNKDLSQGGDTCSITSSLYMNGTYTIQLNGTSSGALTFANNVILDCNNSIIIGNFTNHAIVTSFRSNVTIRRCIFKNYNRGLSLSSGSNITIINSSLINNSVNLYLNAMSKVNVTNVSFVNSSSYNIHILLASNNLNFMNSTFYTKNQLFIYALNNYNLVFDYNNFYGTNQTNERISFYNDSNLNFSNNNIYNFQDLGFFNTGVQGSSDVIMNNNYLFNSSYVYGTVNIGINATRFNITNNILNQTSYGILLDSSATEISSDDNEIYYTNECLGVNVSYCSLFANRIYQFPGGNYNMNASSVISLNGNNITLDCNYSNFTGTAYGTWLSSNYKSNITVYNCNINNYSYGISLASGKFASIFNVTFNNNLYGIYLNRFNNSLINNNSFSNNTLSLYAIGYSVPSYNVTFTNNNIFTKSGGFANSLDTVGLFVANNKFRGFNASNNNGNLIRFAMSDNKNVTIYKNNFTDFSYIYESIRNRTNRGNNINITDNIFYNSTYIYSIYITNADNIFIHNNIINISDIGIDLVQSNNNISIKNNIIQNSYTQFDEYNTGIYLIDDRNSPSGNHSSNIIIYNNSFIDFGCNGFMSRGADNINISNNYFSQNYNILLANRYTYLGNGNFTTTYWPFSCMGEPFTAIMLKEIYKGYMEGGTQQTDAYSMYSQHENSNITIRGNTFNNINTLLRSQGTVNLTHDLTNYYYSSFQIPYLMDKDEFYISSSFDSLVGLYPNGNLNYNFWQGTVNNATINYTITKNYSYFKSIFVADFNLTLFNNPVVHTDNQLIQFNISAYNFSFSPSQELYSYNRTLFNTTKSWTNALFFYPNKSNVDPINRKLTGYFNVEYLIDPSINMTYAYDNFAGTPQSMEVTDSIDFYLCNSSNTFTILNFTFVDETNSSNKLNGTINEAYFTYYPDLNPSVVKTYSFISSINSENFSLCITPKEFNYSFNYTLIYSGNGYGTKTKATNGYTSYQNISNNIELPLLNSTNIVTFQVINTFNQQIEGVYAYVLPYLNDTILSSGYTDSGGIIQFLLQNGTTYRLYFSKSGYDSYSTIQNIGDTFYTITLNGLGIPSVPSDGGGYTGGTGGGTSSAVPNSIGVTYKTYPLNTWLNNGTYYYFNFSLNSGSWNFTNWGFNITDQSNNLINATSSTNATGGNLGLNVSTNNYTRIVMNFYYVINGNRTNLQRTWLVLDTSDNQFSIAHAIDDTTNYVNSGLFGITGFGVSFIVFFIIFIGAGVLSYKYGLTSPTAICGFVFAAVWFFDVYLNWIPTPIGAVQHFTTIIIGIVLFGMIVREVAQ